MIRRLVFLVGVLLVVAIAAVGIYLFVPSVGEVSNEAIAHSAAREAGADAGKGPKSCKPSPGEGKRRRCVVRAESGRGRASYVLVFEGDRCWEARRAGARGKGGASLPRRLDGCVALRDQLRLDTRL